jgi:hypothetical protein
MNGPLCYDCGGNQIPLSVLSLNKDIEFGLSAEPEVINHLSKYFKEEITKTEDPYCRHDAESQETKYEIKTRRNKYAAFPTTIIPVHKTKVEGRLVFVFKFTDGLYYCVYDPVQFALYEIKNVVAIRRGGVRTSLPHYYIPIKNLVKIDI